MVQHNALIVCIQMFAKIVHAARQVSCVRCIAFIPLHKKREVENQTER